MALYIGVMSGTSLDGIDLVLVRFGQSASEKLQPELLDSLLCPFPEQLRQQLSQLAQSGPDELELMGLVEQQLALAYADAVKQLLAKTKVSPEQIKAIGLNTTLLQQKAIDKTIRLNGKVTVSPSHLVSVSSIILFVMSILSISFRSISFMKYLILFPNIG